MSMADDGDLYSGLTSAINASVPTVPTGGGDALNVGASTQGLTDEDLINQGVIDPNAPTAPSGGNIGGLLGTLAAGGGLAYSMLRPDVEQQQLGQLQGAATGAGTTATALQAPLMSGTLPAGAQQAINASQAAQTAKIRSSYSSMGMAGSTGEADALNAVQQNIAAQKFSIETNMMEQASKFAQLQSADLEALLKDQMQKDQNFGNALSNFTNALSKTSLPSLSSIGSTISSGVSDVGNWISGLFG